MREIYSDKLQVGCPKVDGQIIICRKGMSKGW